MYLLGASALLTGYVIKARGQFVVACATGVWATGPVMTMQTGSNFRLNIQDNGNMILAAKDSSTVWSSNTADGSFSRYFLCMLILFMRIFTYLLLHFESS